MILGLFFAIQPQSLKATKKHKEKEQSSMILDGCNRFWML